VTAKFPAVAAEQPSAREISINIPTPHRQIAGLTLCKRAFTDNEQFTTTHKRFYAGARCVNNGPVLLCKSSAKGKSEPLLIFFLPALSFWH
jgi:hypothetical protein